MPTYINYSIAPAKNDTYIQAIEKHGVEVVESKGYTIVDAYTGFLPPEAIERVPSDVVMESIKIGGHLVVCIIKFVE